MSSETVKAKYSIDNEIHEVTGTGSACYTQLDVLLTVYGDRFKFLGTVETEKCTRFSSSTTLTGKQLYSGFNGRIFCKDCAGMTARASDMRIDLHGTPIIKITEEDRRDWIKDIGRPMCCESCGG